jgi:hypothetical protein
MIIEGCEQSDGAWLCASEVEGRVFTGESLMYAGFALKPMRGDYPGVQLLFERVGAEEV